MLTREQICEMAYAAQSALKLGDYRMYEALMYPIWKGEFVNDKGARS